MGSDAHAETLVKDLAIAAALVLVALAIVGGVVLGLGDDEFLVSPPESVAQEFVRAMALGQIGTARRMLSRDSERRTSNDEVRRISSVFRSRIGRLDDVQGTVEQRRRDTTLVRARVQGERANTEPVLALVREFGAWSVASASDVLTADTQASSRPADHR
jgi:hypothetical protein